MPGFKRKRTNGGRRKFSKRPKKHHARRRKLGQWGVARRPVITRTLSAMPGKMRSVMTYWTDMGQFNPETPPDGVATWRDIRANSIHDPDETGVGGQPHWHDEWAQFYRFYNVYRMDYRLVILPVYNAGSVDLYGHIYADVADTQDGVHALTARDMMEGSRYRKRLVRWPYQGDKTSSIMLSGTIYPNRVISQQDQERYWTVFNNNPATVARLRIAFANTSPNTTISVTSQLRGYIQLKYYVTMKQVEANKQS